MTALLALPFWMSIHPTVIHFPIVLLLMAPVFVLIGALLPPQRSHPFMISALILLGLGTVSLFLAIPTGEAAANFVPQDSNAQEVLRLHANLALETRGIFVMLLVLYISIILVPKRLRQNGRLLSTVLPLAFLLLYCAGAVVLVGTVRHGTRLVHEFGVHAVLVPHAEQIRLADRSQGLK